MYSTYTLMFHTDCTTWCNLLASIELQLHEKKLFLNNTVDTMVGVVPQKLQQE